MTTTGDRFSMTDFDGFEGFDRRELESALLDGSRLAARSIPATCGDCLYFTLDGRTSDVGTCRRHPPVPIEQPSRTALRGVLVVPQWPRIGPGTPGCGDGVRGRHPNRGRDVRTSDNG